MNESKSIFASMTFWGALLSIAAPIAAMAKVDIGDPSLWASAIASIVGGVLAIIGRVKAVKRIG